MEWWQVLLWFALPGILLTIFLLWRTFGTLYPGIQAIMITVPLFVVALLRAWYEGSAMLGLAVTWTLAWWVFLIGTRFSPANVIPYDLINKWMDNGNIKYFHEGPERRDLGLLILPVWIILSAILVLTIPGMILR